MIVGFTSLEYTAYERNEQVQVCVGVISFGGISRPFTVALLPEEGNSRV